MDIKPEILELSSKIDAMIEVDTNGVGTETSSIYETMIPDLLSSKLPEKLRESVKGEEMTVMKAANQAEIDLTAAVTYSAGKLFIDRLKSEKDLKECSMVVKMTEKDTLSIFMNREKTYPNPAGGDPIVNHGVVRVSHDKRTDKNVGNFKAVRKGLAEIAELALKQS